MRTVLAKAKHVLRNKILDPAAFRLGLLSVRLNQLKGAKVRPYRMLVVSDRLVYTSEQQFAPMKRHAAELRRELGVVIRFMSVEDALRLRPARLAAYSAVGLKLSFRTPAAGAERVATELRQKINPETTRFIYFDGDDDVCVLWPAVLRAVDLYVKKHVFSDTNNYHVGHTGKSNLTDYVARTYGTSFASNEIPQTSGLAPDDLKKIRLGWNIGLDDLIAGLYRSVPLPSQSEKTIDVVCRAAVAPTQWIFPLRDTVLQELKKGESRFKVMLPTHRVPLQQYHEEMRQSRICVSPFGYGEICWRDFEAVLFGCLLIKADMGHIRTEPDIFVPGVTYVPVKWDYSDLLEKCEYYLAHEAERVRIVERAHAALSDYYREKGFVRTFSRDIGL